MHYSLLIKFKCYLIRITVNRTENYKMVYTFNSSFSLNTKSKDLGGKSSFDLGWNDIVNTVVSKIAKIPRIFHS